MASDIFVSSDLFDKVFADERPAGSRQEDRNFSDIAETELNAMIGSQNKNTKKKHEEKHINMTHCI